MTFFIIILKELHGLAHNLAQQQVGQAAGAEAEKMVVEPFLTEHLLHDGIVYDNGL